MAETQASALPYDRDIEMGAPPPYMGETGAPPPYEEATSRPPFYVPNEPVTRLAIDDLLVSFQSESVSRVDEVPATTSHERTRQSPTSPNQQNPIHPNQKNANTRRTANQNKVVTAQGNNIAQRVCIVVIVICFIIIALILIFLVFK